MAKIKDSLPDEVIREIRAIGKADILIGIPSYNNAGTIGHVVRAVSIGLAKYFPHERAVIVNADGGSTDGTADVVRNAGIEDIESILLENPANNVRKIITAYRGISGKGSAFRTIFTIAKELSVKASAVVDSDLRSITPEWVELLIDPIYHRGYDFVAPLYLRHKFDATITNNIVFPLTRALYGKRIRQPIGGDFGFSDRLTESYLSHKVWYSDISKFGIDIWMTTNALTNGFKVCQSYLGAKIHNSKDPGADLSQMLTQVLGVVFCLMEVYREKWWDVRTSEPIQEFGFKFEVGLKPIEVDIERMVKSFKKGFGALGQMWEKVLSPQAFSEIESIVAGAEYRFTFPIDLWVKIVYDYALSYHRRVLARKRLLKSFVPLYYGRTAAFILENLNSSPFEVEEKLEQLCISFEQQKDYLLKNW